MCLLSVFLSLLSGLTARVIDRTKSMSDVYGAFFDFSCMLGSKVWSQSFYKSFRATILWFGLFHIYWHSSLLPNILVFAVVDFCEMQFSSRWVAIFIICGLKWASMTLLEIVLCHPLWFYSLFNRVSSLLCILDDPISFFFTIGWQEWSKCCSDSEQTRRYSENLQRFRSPQQKVR